MNPFALFVRGISAILLAAGMPVLAQAVDVELQPGYISGTTSIAGAPLSRASISANSVLSGYIASTNVVGGGDYTLTVNTPAGGSMDYDVLAVLYSDGNRDVMYTRKQRVAVSDGQITAVDFTENPGFVQGRVTLTGGATIAGGTIYAARTAGGVYTNARTQIASDGTFHFPVQPNAYVKLYGNVRTTDGQNINLGNQYQDIAAGQTVTQDWSIAVAPTGAIVGTIALNGATNFHWHQVYGKGSATVYANPGSYAFTGVPEGSYNINGYTYFSSGKGSFQFPVASHSNRRVTVTAGSTAVDNIEADAAWISGNLTLSGSKSIQDVTSGGVNATGVWGSPSWGGNSHDGGITDGSFDLVVSSGAWDIVQTDLAFYDPDTTRFLNSSLHIHDYARDSRYGGTSTTVAGGETANVSLAYATGTVTVNFSVAGGGTLAKPRLSGSRTTVQDAASGDYCRASVNAYGPDAETTQGVVTFVGLPGIYTINAYAVVNGSFTSFGQFEVEVVAGSDVVIDIGGPSLTVTSPTPEMVTASTNLQVSGMATDDTGVASVVINGVTATLSSTNNANDPNEVSFAAVVPVESGMNTIRTVATDNAGKEASDSRKVYVDSGPPALSWSPADGLVTQADSITVQGTATDDNGITKITVNGQSVAFAASGNPADANEVSFSASVALTDGANTIVVTATDIAKQVASQTHTVTRITNRSPVADAGSYARVEQTSASGATVTLDGSGSFDPDGDALSYAWSGPFGSATGVAPSVLLPPGTSNVNLVVHDGTVASAPSTAIITVSDTTTPTLTVPADVTAEATGVQTTVDPGIATASDLVDGAVNVSSDAPATFPLGTTTVTYTAMDAAGNTATATQNVTVVDTTAPALTVPADITAEATGVQTAVDSGMATASDLVDGAVSVSSDAPATFPLGTTVVTWTASDAAGNRATATQNVTVVDTTAPTFSLSQQATALWPVNHKMVLAVTISGVSDAVDPEPTVNVSVSSNQAANGKGDGNTSADWQIVENNGVWQVWLRAERAAPTGDRNYTVTVRVTDAAGNATSRSAAVTVPHSQGRK